MPKKSSAQEESTSNTEITTTMELLQLTQAQVYILKEPAGKTKALVRLMINDQLQLTGVRVVDGANGLFVCYPNDPGYKGDDYRSLFYPVTREFREHIEEVVLEKYQQALLADSSHHR